jgi:glyoxylase-like metal-dependent hydrolase (beta-lactamase superfamily II)
MISRTAVGDAKAESGLDVHGFFDPRTFSVQYVAACRKSRHCAIIDPVLDFDLASGSTATTSADGLLRFVRDNGLTVAWVLDTHPHADHFSAAAYLHDATGAPMAIGEKVLEVQALWEGIYGFPAGHFTAASWDRLFRDGDSFAIGEVEARVIHSPGHTLASITYLVDDAAFVHDTLFMPDFGTARTDFPGGSAEDLWRSIETILSLPDATRLFTGHDYLPEGRGALWESTVAEQRSRNIHLVGTDREKFIAMRTARDRTLPLPRLMLSALQVNLRGGRLPPERHLRIPLGAFPSAAW